MGNVTVHPEHFARAMKTHWETRLGNVANESLFSLWETMAKAFNAAISRQDNRWAVLQPPTGTGKTQGLMVYAAMLAMQNQTAENPVGLLVVTRLIDQANELCIGINQMANFECAIAKHSEENASVSDIQQHDVLIVTHASYVRALDGLCHNDASRWTKLIEWKHGKRGLTIVDEALTNIIDEYQVKAEDIRQVLSFITPDLRLQYPSQVETLESVSRTLEILANPNQHIGSNLAPSLIHAQVISPDKVGSTLRLPHTVSMESLRGELAGLPFDRLVLRKESASDRKRISAIVDKTLRDVDRILAKWAYYVQKGKEHSINASQLLIPVDLPSPVVLDATASQNFLWELLEDRADIKSIPPNTRNYSNVTLHVSRASAIGKSAMTKDGQVRIPRVLSHLEQVLGEDRRIFMCVHKRVEHIAMQYAPKFKDFKIGHWGAIDGLNEWKDFDAAVILGIPYRDQIWATNAFFAVQGLQTNAWFSNPKWKSYADVREELQTKQVSVSIIQSINRIRCRKVIDIDGHCSPCDIFIVLPVGIKGDRILRAIQDEMPHLKIEDWEFDIDGDKARVRRNTSHEALVSFMENRHSGETSFGQLEKELNLGKEGIKSLKATLRDLDHPLPRHLKTIGVSYMSTGYGRGSRSYLLKI